MIAIQFINNSSPYKLKNVKKLKELVYLIFEKEGISVRKIVYIFCKDDELLKLNFEFLKHDTFTDILTFRLSEKHEAVESEIYISVERVLENSKKFRVSYEDELGRVIIHGALHLCGYNDKKLKDKKRMREKEFLYLEIFKNNVSRETN